jgi:protein SCO1
MMPYKFVFMILVLVVAACAGCGRDRGGGEQERASQTRVHKGTAAPDAGVTDYVLKGVVKRVEKEREHVTIQHEAIPGFMDAMTMRFAYKDKDSLDSLRAGDHVQGTLRVQKAWGVVQAYELLGLTVNPAAPAPPTPDISRNKALMREQPRRLETGDPVPDFTMTGQDGHAIKLSDLRGNVVVLTFIYTRCPLPDFCPFMDKKFAELAGRIAAFPGRARQIRLISLSFDPDHDTPELLRKHAQSRGATPPLWSFAVASHAELAKIGAPLGLFYQPGASEIAHNLCTAIIDPQGRLARLQIGTESNKWDTAEFQRTIYSLLAAPQK